VSRAVGNRRWLNQTTLHNPPTERGNCTEACLASLFGVSIEEIGTFHNQDGDVRVFWERFEAAIARFGCYAVRFDVKPPQTGWVFDGYYLAGGDTARGTKHCVVMLDGELAHDPHPSKAGLTKVDHCHLIVPLDPAVVVRPTP